MSVTTPEQFAYAVITNDVSKLTKIQGVGAKTAQRLILELKDKLKTEQAVSKNEKVEQAIADDNVTYEAISALQILGYNKKEIEKAFEKLDLKGLAVEDIIRKALGILGK